MRNVFIQKGSDGEILNPNLFAAFEGFSKKNYDIHFFTILPDTTDRDDIVCGGIGTVRSAWRYMNVALPPELDYPAELTSYLGRKIWAGTLGEVRKNLFSDQPLPYFVKPKLTHKLFTGKVLFSPRCLNETTQHDAEVAVWISEPVQFVSEYRMFVLRGVIHGCKNYYGSFEVLPDFDLVRAAIAAYTSSPVAYSIDFGVTQDGRTLLVEVNDGFALGNYGLDPFRYAQFIEARWDEVTGSTYLRDALGQEGA